MYSILLKQYVVWTLGTDRRMLLYTLLCPKF